MFFAPVFYHLFGKILTNDWKDFLQCRQISVLDADEIVNDTWIYIWPVHWITISLKFCSCGTGLIFIFLIHGWGRSTRKLETARFSVKDKISKGKSNTKVSINNIQVALISISNQKETSWQKIHVYYDLNLDSKLN